MIGVRLDGRCIVHASEPPRPPHQHETQNDEGDKRTQERDPILFYRKKSDVVIDVKLVESFRDKTKIKGRCLHPPLLIVQITCSTHSLNTSV